MSISSYFTRFLSKRDRKTGRALTPASKEQAIRLILEALEDRTLPSTTSILPTPVVTNNGTAFAPASGTVITGTTETIGAAQPKVVVDPFDSTKMVAIYAQAPEFDFPATAPTEGLVHYEYSNNSGATWIDPGANTYDSTQFGVNLGVNAIDPQTDPNTFNQPTVPYSEATSPTIAFDRNNNFYVLASLNNAADTSGALVLSKFSFAGSAPAATFKDQIVQQWIGHDPMYNPVVAVDNTLTTYTDPQTGATTPTADIDTTPDQAVWVFWDTRVPGAQTAGQTPAPYAVKALVSPFGGGTSAGPSVPVGTDANFTTPVYVNNENAAQFTNAAQVPIGAPAVVFSQPSIDGRVPGGDMLVAWADGNGNIFVDNSQINSNAGTGVAGAAQKTVADTYTFAGNTGSIPDATANYTGTPPNLTRQLPDTPSNAVFNDTVDITDANFGSVVDANVTINLTSPHTSDLSIDLITPWGLDIPLLLNRINDFGTTNLNGDLSVQGIADSSTGTLGVVPNRVNPAFALGTIFDQQATVTIQDPNETGTYVGFFRPEQFSNLSNNPGGNFNSGGLNQINGHSPTGFQPINGTWQLRIRDNFNETAASPNPLEGNDPQSQLVSWNIHFDSSPNTAFTNYFGADNNVVVATSVGAAATSPYPTTSNAAATFGIPPSISLAQDRTLGSFSPYEGRVYLAYTGPGTGGAASFTDNTDVYLIASDFTTNFVGGPILWNALTNSAGGHTIQINNDSALDQINSEGDRPQFDPSVAVDPITGAVVVSWYDARQDAARARVATYVAASIDGGQDFSPETYLNEQKTAVDEVTGATDVLEPVPDNMSLAGLVGFGTNQGLAVYAGHIFDLWTGNENAGNNTTTLGGDEILTATVTIAAGPRVTQGDEGPVVNDFVDPSSGTVYNNTFASDGTRQFTSFVVHFDRPVNPNTFGVNQVEVEFRSPTTPANQAGTFLMVQSVTPLDLGNFGLGYGPAAVGIPGVADLIGLATTFLITLTTPQSAVGTYSYAIGPTAGNLPTISDRMRGTVNGVTLLGNEMDQNSNTVTAEPQVDQFAEPTPLGGVPFQLPYDPNTLPLIIPGPHAVDYTTGNMITGSPTTGPDGAVVAIPPAANATTPTVVTSTINIDNDLFIHHATLSLDIAFHNDQALTAVLIAPDGTQITLFSGVGGGNSNFTNTIFDDTASTEIQNGAAAFTGSFIPQQSLDQALNGKTSAGVWTLQITNTDTAGTTSTTPDELLNWSLTLGQGDNLVLNGSTSSVNVVFDRDINPASFTPATILRMVGPNGPITGPFTVTADPPGTPAALAKRVFAIGFPTQTINGTYSVTLAPSIVSVATPTALSGNMLDTNLNAGLYVLKGTDPTTATLATKTYGTGVANTLIPPAATTTYTLNVPDSFVVQDATVKLTINFANDPDLKAVLVSPDGTSVQLFAGVGNLGASTANFTGTVFADNATVPIQQGIAPFNAVPAYNPQFPLAAFIGHPSQGLWKLIITNANTTKSGTLVSWSINLQESVPGTGLGEAVADQYTTSFRIFTQDPTNPLTQSSWTAVGPVARNTTNTPANFSRITAVAVDPSDPSGNTVYVGTGVGGLWKTTNFLTTDPNGPTYVPLTDFGPNQGLSITSILIIPVNGDPKKSIIIAGTGDGDGGIQGVGFLYSANGGQTWALEDSATNYSVTGGVVGALLPLNAAARNHIFVGANIYKIVVDPNSLTSTNKVLYAAVSGGTAQGLYKSTDSGRDWFLLRAGAATDVQLSLGSTVGSDGLIQIIYAAFQGDGVYISQNEGGNGVSAGSWTLMAGGNGQPLIRDNTTQAAIPVANDAVNPNGAQGRIVLAAPNYVPNQPLENFFYSSWLYALTNSGLYVTKDFGLNWTKVDLGVLNGFPTNNETKAGDPFDPTNYAETIAVDPSNPNIVYLGGTSLSGLIRVDLTDLSDPQAFVGYDNSDSTGTGVGGAQTSTTGPLSVSTPAYTVKNSVTQTLPPGPTPYLNLSRDPNNPFISLSTISVAGAVQFSNQGDNVTWLPFNAASPQPTQTNVLNSYHQVVAMTDPLTGETRLVIAGETGVYTGVDMGGAQLNTSIGTQTLVNGARNGNLQIAELNYGALQPSSLASDIANALFYATTGPNPSGADPHAPELGIPQSSTTQLQNGNVVWSTSAGGGAGIETDPTGNGIEYIFLYPGLVSTHGVGGPTDFFQLVIPGATPVSRTTGLLRGNDNPGNNVGEWPEFSGSTFALSPFDPVRNATTGGIVMSSQTGEIFRTTNNGLNWFPLFQTTGDSYAGAVAFGAPDPTLGIGPDDFIYAGTQNGHIYVTSNGGQFTDISTGLDGSAVQQIITDPNPTMHDAYAVTSDGVYYMANSLAAAPTWVNITGNLFSLQRNYFNTPYQIAQGVTTQTAQYMQTGGLTSLAIDWRFTITNDPTRTGAGLPTTHPVLYVGGVGGVVRSEDQGDTWTIFPNVAIDGATQDGGFLPDVRVTSLSLTIGQNATGGAPSRTDQSSGYGILYATTQGRGAFDIHLPSNLYPGPRVASLVPEAAVGGAVSAVDVTFGGAVDPSTFTLADIDSITGPNGQVITPLSVTDITDQVNPPTAGQGSLHNIYRITFAPQSAAGVYNISIGPNISDFSGDLMNQTFDGLNGQTPSDIYTGHFYLDATAAGPTAVTLFGENPAAGTVISDTTNGVVSSSGKLSQGSSFYTLFPNTVTWISVHSGDFNGDGKADMVGEMAETGQIWVTTTGGTTSQWLALDLTHSYYNFGTAANPDYLLTGDFNGDGKTDIAVHDLTTGLWYVGLSNGVNGFNYTVWGTIGNSVTWQNTVVGDFLGNGKSDIVAQLQQTGQWIVWLSNGSNGFTAEQWLNSGTGGTWVTPLVGDFNGAVNATTGRPIQDLAFRWLQTGNWYVGFSNGVNEFTDLVSNSPSTKAWSTFGPNGVFTDVHAADFNGDGKDDIIGRLTNAGASNGFYVILSAGTVVAPTPTPTKAWAVFGNGYTWQNTVFGDFNGGVSAAGKPIIDVAMQSLQTGQWFVWVPTPNSAAANSFTSSIWASWGTASTWVNAQAADYDGNGTPDIIARSLQTGQWMLGLSSAGGKSFTTTTWATWTPPNPTWVDFQYADFNGDGKTDIAARVLQTGQWFVAVNNGSAGYTTELWADWGSVGVWADVQTGDFNGDGKADILGLLTQTGNFYVALSNGQGFYTTQATGVNYSPGTTFDNVRVGDFNGAVNASTGLPIDDFVGRLALTGQWFVSVSNGAPNGAANFTTSVWGTTDTTKTLVDVQIGDFAGNGTDDILGRYSQTGQWFLWTPNAGGGAGTSFSTQAGTLWTTWGATAPSGAAWTSVVSGDFNGDGKKDIAGMDPTTGTWYVSTSNGTTGTAPTAWVTWGPGPWVDIQVGDVNGDGKDDIVGRYLYGGNVIAAESTPTGAGSLGTSFTDLAFENWDPSIAWAHVFLGKSM